MVWCGLSPDEVFVGFQLYVNAHSGTGGFAALDAGLQQAVSILHLAELQLQFTHLVVQLLLHYLHAQHLMHADLIAAVMIMMTLLVTSNDVLDGETQMRRVMKMCMSATVLALHKLQSKLQRL